MRLLFGFIALVILVYVLQFLGTLFLYVAPPILTITIAIFLTVRLPAETFKPLLGLVTFGCGLLALFWLWALGAATQSELQFVNNIYLSIFTSPIGVTVLVLLLVLLFSQTRNYMLKASRLFWVAIFAAVLFGLASHINSLEANETLINMIFGLGITSLTLIPLVLLRWYEMWPIVICGALFGSFFISIANSAQHPSLEDSLAFITVLAGGIVPALISNMILMNLIRNRYNDKPLVNSVYGKWPRRLTKFAVSIIILGTSFLFMASIYWVSVIEDYPEIPQRLFTYSFPYIIFTLLVVCLNWISLTTRHDDIPPNYALIVIALVSIGFLAFSERFSTETLQGSIAKAFWFACGIEAIGGLLTFGLENYYNDASTIQKFLIFAGLILLLAVFAHFLNIDSPIYWGIVGGFMGGFIEFTVLKQMEEDSEDEPQEKQKPAQQVAA